jgi:hypothetical protein
LEIELKNIILRRVSIFEFLHSQGRMQKQVYAFRLSYGAVARERQRIDRSSPLLMSVSNLEITRGAPRSGLLDLGHFAFEEPFLDVDHCAPPSSYRGMAGRMAATLQMSN